MVPIKMLKSAFNLKWNQILANPFFIYAFAFLGALFLYELKWINYPKLSPDVYIFIISTVIISIIIGLYVKIPNHISVVFGINQNYLFKTTLVFFIISSIGFIITFIDSGTLFGKILFSDIPINYKNYNGIKFFTRIVKVIHAAVFIFSFHFYLTFRDKRYLWIIFLGFIPVLLLFNRLYAAYIIIPSFFIFLFHINFKFKKVLFLLSVSFIILSFIFGIIGNYREQAKIKKEDTHLFYKLDVKNYPQWLPKDFIWVYFYISSPIGKFEYTVEDQSINRKENDYIGLVTNALLPGSLGARLGTLFKVESRESVYKYPGYYVGTVYRDAYYYAHWNGVIITFLVLCFFMFFALFILKRKNMFWIGIPLISQLNTMMFFSPFGNVLLMTTPMFTLYVVVLFTNILQKFTKARLRF
ncbi:O-antigen polymerase [Saccharicrinis sp. FJH62]|uniref:O-antigen polymerase n=1 Tax=Saccharicrinis sp. FJH62 TaxID=3344657 RepID=UPI0035D508B9